MGNPTETWQGYSADGAPAKAPVTQVQAADGALHGASHVWIWRKGRLGKEVLLQRRATDKRTWPGYYDISAAGHIVFGDSPLQTALKETMEEIGVQLNADQAVFLFTQRAHIVSKATQVTHENELRWVYAYELTEDVGFQFTDGEVEATWWVDLPTFTDLIAGKIKGKSIVPQGEPYFVSLLAGLDQFV